MLDFDCKNSDVIDYGVECQLGTLVEYNKMMNRAGKKKEQRKIAYFPRKKYKWFSRSAREIDVSDHFFFVSCKHSLSIAKVTIHVDFTPIFT